MADSTAPTARLDGPSPLLLAARLVMDVRPCNWDDPEDPAQAAAWSALEAALTPGPDELGCGICTLGFVEGDPCLNDVDLGPVHAACCGPERESYVGADGEPLKDGEPVPTPWKWSAGPTGRDFADRLVADAHERRVDRELAEVREVCIDCLGNGGDAGSRFNPCPTCGKVRTDG